MTRRPGVLRGAALVLALAMAGWHFGRAAWIEAKACLAQHLINRAWQRERTGAGDVRPWPWADTHPVARLVVPGQDVDLMVLAGASGRTMAFGPGYLSGTPLPGEAGNAVVSGHRDTHFAFLQRLKVGDPVVIERRDGEYRWYVVGRTFVVDRRETWVTEDTDDTRLTLVTCYPFDAIRPGGPLRYVVSAETEGLARVLSQANSLYPLDRPLGAAVSCASRGPDPQAAEVDALAQSRHEAGELDGAVLVARAGEVICRKAFGVADCRSGEENTPGTVFSIASTTKPFTALAVMMLSEEGRVDLQAPVSAVLEGFPYEDVTVEHLLTHTSGIPNYAHNRPSRRRHPATRP